MSLNDPLANVLSQVLIDDKKGNKVTVLKNNSKTIRKVLDILTDNKYVGSYKVTDDGKSGELELNLLGAINKVGVIKPRYMVQVSDYEKFEKRFLPAFGFGLLIVSTSKGMMTQEDAIKKKLGGRLIAYVY